VEHNFHGTDDQLEQYALDRLPDVDLPRLEEHLMTCATCREKLDEIGDFALGMREAAPRQTEWFGWMRAWMRRPAFSMALAFAALIIVVAIFSSGRMKFAPVVSLQLTATRGAMPFAVPGREFDLTLADAPREGGPFRVEVVNAMGLSLWSGLAETSPAGVQVMVMRRLPPGDYLVRLSSATGTMLHEYGFRVRA
jgi:hypothetical protein